MSKYQLAEWVSVMGISVSIVLASVSLYKLFGP